jgi:Skp family chaperone for outer membrane proteins
MIKLLKPALAAGLAAAALASPAMLAPVAAQQVAGIGVVNPQAVVVNSAAFQTAQQQRPVTYKAQIDAATARRQAIAAQLQPLYQKLQTDSQAANAAQNQAALQQQYAQIQQIEGTGERELNQILAPVQLSVAYVEEQLTDQLPAAIQAAATKKNVTLVLSPEGVLYGAAPYNMNQDVLAELNALLPTAQLVPPQGWLPREMREQQEAQAQAAAAQQPAASTTQPVSGR